MQSVVQAFNDNWDVVASAPYAVLVLALVIAVTMWTFVSFLKAHEISTLETRLKLRDDEIAELKRTKHEAGASVSARTEDAQQARRRAIVNDGRRLMAAFNSQTLHKFLIEYLATKEEWHAIRPHLDPEVLQNLENGRLLVLTSGTEKDGKIHALLRDFDRLEREWGLI
tara:strand:- start:323 stop:829 length:507 start_codon:yes stop_codon:yes gene_type:complete